MLIIKLSVSEPLFTKHTMSVPYLIMPLPSKNKDKVLQNLKRLLSKTKDSNNSISNLLISKFLKPNLILSQLWIILNLDNNCLRISDNLDRVSANLKDLHLCSLLKPLDSNNNTLMILIDHLMQFPLQFRLRQQ